MLYKYMTDRVWIFMLLYLTENMIISTSDNFKYEWITAPRNRDSIVLEIRTVQSKQTIQPVHIVLAEEKVPGDRMYRLTLGDLGNSFSWIGKGKHGNKAK